MDQLLMLSLIFATVGIPAFYAYRYKSKGGLQAMLMVMAGFMIIYIVLLVHVLPRLIF